VLAIATFFLVVRPAVERGGAGELALIAGFFAVVLLFERWLRGR
jgi:hypothetical protein